MSSAVLQASDQKEAEDMLLLLKVCFKEALHRQWPQCRSYVAAARAAVFEKRARALVTVLLRDAPPAAGAKGHCAASHIWLELNFGYPLPLVES